MRNICRFEYCRVRGWWVQFRRPGKAGGSRRINKLFSDNKYGGSRQALKAAMVWRDQIESVLPPPQPGHKARKKRRRSAPSRLTRSTK